MTDDPPRQLPAHVYYGMANTWDCDEMGHLNVRFYIRKAEEALAGLFLEAGLGPRRRAEGGPALRLLDHHVRYLRELMPGTAIFGRAGFIQLTEDGGVAAIELLRSSDVAPAASFLARFRFEQGGAAAAWPADVRARAEDLSVPSPPPHVGPRSVLFADRGPNPTLADARRFGLQTIRQGTFQSVHFAPSGELYAENFIGLISDGIPNFVRGGREEAAAHAGASRVGGAALEYRMTYREQPRPGDVVAVMSGPRAVSEKTFHFVHWTFCLETGVCLASSENVAVSLDLETRKVIPVPPARREALLKTIQPDLWV